MYKQQKYIFQRKLFGKILMGSCKININLWEYPVQCVVVVGFSNALFAG